METDKVQMDIVQLAEALGYGQSYVGILIKAGLVPRADMSVRRKRFWNICPDELLELRKALHEKKNKVPGKRKSKSNVVKVLFLSDGPESMDDLATYIIEKYLGQQAFTEYMDYHGYTYKWGKEKPYPFKHVVITDMVEEAKGRDYFQVIRDHVHLADVVFFDYGGLSCGLGGGGDHMIDYHNREFMKMIDDYPSKTWVCISNMATFEREEEQALKEKGVKFQWEQK